MLRNPDLNGELLLMTELLSDARKFLHPRLRIVEIFVKSSDLAAPVLVLAVLVTIYTMTLIIVEMLYGNSVVKKLSGTVAKWPF